MYINGTQISTTSGKYPFLSMLYTLFDSKESVETYRALSLYSKETEGYMDELRTESMWVDVNSEADAGLSKELPGSREAELAKQAGRNGVNNTRTRRAVPDNSQPTGSSSGSGSGSSSGSGSGGATDAGSQAGNNVQKFTKIIGGTNSSMAWRHEKLSSGHEYLLIGKIDMDCFNIDTYLVNGAALKIKFTQSSPQFRIIQPEGEVPVEIVLVDLVFRPYYIHLSPELVIATEDMFKSGRTALMPFRSEFIDSYTVAPGPYRFIFYQYQYKY